MRKFNKTFGKFMSGMLALTFALSAASCISEGEEEDVPEYDESTTTIIKVVNYGGGVGRKWLDQAGERFYELTKNTSYEEGKKGVGLEVSHTQKTNITAIKTAAYHIYFDQPSSYASVSSIMQQGLLLDISDIVTETLSEDNKSIEDKIPEAYRFTLKANDGKYYMLPHYEFYGSASYDVDLFDRYGFYLAQDGNGEEYYCELTGETVYFTATASEKTVGNDGKLGTSDDGMPTTLDELVAMCDYMYEEGGVIPFSVAGGHIDYNNALLAALWTAMAGYEGMSATFNFTGEVECVKLDENDNYLYTNKDIWKGSGIKVPQTEKATVTEETGYKAINHVARYYAYAFVKLAEQQGWYYNKFKETNYNHKEAMKAFILNGIGENPEIGAHVEPGYWYNEMKDYGLMEDYKMLADTDEVKNIAHWNMPTSYGDDKVTSEANAREEAVMNTTCSYAFINGNLDDDPGNEGLIQACKDFLQFLYTENELLAFTKQTGVAKAKVEYTLTNDAIEGLETYPKSVMSLRQRTRVVQQESNNPTYLTNAGQIYYSAGAVAWKPHFSGTTYNNVLEAYVDGYSVKECFEVTGYTSSKWINSMYVK